MGERTHGGKGDKSRVTDRETFWDNYDKIFRKEEGKESYPQLHELAKEEEPIDIDRIVERVGNDVRLSTKYPSLRIPCRRSSSTAKANKNFLTRKPTRCIIYA